MILAGLFEQSSFRMKEFFRLVSYWIYRLLPKFNHAVVYGWPDFEDSCLALQAELNKTKVRKVILFISKAESKSPLPLGEKTTVVIKDSMRGLFWFLCAKYVFFTHRCFMWKFPPNVVSVNVWHGMPIKRIGWMLSGNRGISSRYALATSKFWADIIQKSMSPFEKTLITGLPRNDRLFSDRDRVWNRLNLPENQRESKLIAWLPTYRKSVYGEIRQDGRESGNVFGTPGISPARLNEFLKEHNAYAFVKLHPMAPFNGVAILSNLLIFDDNWLRDRELTLYEIVGQSDIMISDISSILVDYLILDRPVIHCFPDIDEYRQSRGFSIEPVTDYFVGPVTTSAEELFAALDQVLKGEDTHATVRRKIRQLFFNDTNNKATVRLLEQIGLPTIR